MPENGAVYASLLRWCATSNSVCRGRRLHAHIDRNGALRSTHLANLLIQMYGRCDYIMEARSVFDAIPRRDLFSWNLIISAYTRGGDHKEALFLFTCLESESGMEPDRFTFLSILPALATLPAARSMHYRILSSGLLSDITLQNALITMYGNCGSPNNARAIFDIFDSTAGKDVISWNAMISVYAKNGKSQDAMLLFRKMGLEGVKPNSVTFLSILNTCDSLQNGREIHEIIDDARESELDVSVKNALLNMYGKWDSPKDAKLLFDQMKVRDAVSWSTMIAAFARNGHSKEALELFRQMWLRVDVRPNKVTFLNALDACVTLDDVSAVHEYILVSGLHSELSLRTALLHTYAKCGSLDDARALFDIMHSQDAVLWTAMITAYLQNGQSKGAHALFLQMDAEGIKPDRITFLCILDACASLACLNHGKVIHARIFSNGLDSDTGVMNALLYMYDKCGSLEDAQAVFNAMHHNRDLISWNTLIAAFAQNGYTQKALQTFQQMMVSEGIVPDKVTFLTILEACANLASLETGRAIHQCLLTNGCEQDSALNNALINMYGKCGSCEDAQVIFEQMQCRDVISWTAMIAACTQNGPNAKALQLFDQMDLEGVKADVVTFTAILNACSHAGMVNEGWHYLVSMSGNDVLPLEEHYLCMIDLLERACCVNETEDLIGNMPVKPEAASLANVLGACCIYGDIERE